MLILFDTSVLIAGFIASHPNHSAALSWLQRAKAGKLTMLVSTHTLAECYAVLTRLPVSPKIPPGMARMLLCENVEKPAKIISLSTSDYFAMIDQVTDLNLSGGIVYDAIAVKAAQKAGAEKILTLNTRDFHRLCPEKTDFILAV